MQGSLRLGSCAIMLALVTTVLATISRGAADIQVLSQNDTSLSMKFTDAVNNQTTLNFSRPTANDLWQAPSGSGTPGIYFGNPSPTFAGPATLRRLGISPTEAVRTFDAAIAGSTLDDITIYRFYDDEMVVALWQEGVIAELWHVGAFVADFDFAEGAEGGCQQMLNRCCRTKPIIPQPELPPFSYPWPCTACCVGVIELCGGGSATLACACLDSACDFCNPNPAPPNPLCETIPGLEARSDDACLKYGQNCDPGPPDPNPMLMVNQVLVEIVNRVQAIIDSL